MDLVKQYIFSAAAQLNVVIHEEKFNRLLLLLYGLLFNGPAVSGDLV